MSLNQVHNAIGHAARLGIQQDALLAVQLADHKKLVPPMGLQARKHCARGDQGIDSIKIPLQVVKLTVYGGFYFASPWLSLFGYIEKSSTCPTTIISGLVSAKVWVLASQIINDPLG
jgi:hypothetical protein